MAGGRPTKYDPTLNDKVTKFCLLGATDVELADFLDVCEATINVWKKKSPEFVESIKKGREEADAHIANALYHRAKGYSHKEDKIFTGGWDEDGSPRDPIVVPTTKHYPPDTAAAFIWLKNRKAKYWTDKSEQIVTKKKFIVNKKKD